MAPPFGDSLALIDLNGSLPELVDVSKGIPGVTHTPVGDGPTEVAASRAAGAKTNGSSGCQPSPTSV